MRNTTKRALRTLLQTTLGIAVLLPAWLRTNTDTGTGGDG